MDNADDLAAAVAGGAGRIELCAALGMGGLTPAGSLMRQAGTLQRRARVPVYAMVRPHAGSDLTWSAADTAQMLDDIDCARDAGLAGVVLGACCPTRTGDSGDGTRQHAGASPSCPARASTPAMRRCLPSLTSSTPRARCRRRRPPGGARASSSALGGGVCSARHRCATCLPPWMPCREVVDALIQPNAYKSPRYSSHRSNRDLG